MIFVVGIVVVRLRANCAFRRIVTDCADAEVSVAVESNGFEEGRGGRAWFEIFFVVVPFAALLPVVFVLEVDDSELGAVLFERKVASICFVAPELVIGKANLEIDRRIVLYINEFWDFFTWSPVRRARELFFVFCLVSTSMEEITEQLNI